MLSQSSYQLVSHHPPISAFHLVMPDLVSVTGYNGQKSKVIVTNIILTTLQFKGMTVKVEQTGEARLTTPQFNDVYKVSFPELTIRGLLSGNIFLDLCGRTVITSESGFTAHVEYLPKPWFSGDYHHIKCTIFRNGQETAPEYTITGRWMQKMMIAKTGQVRTLSSNHLMSHLGREAVFGLQGTPPTAKDCETHSGTVGARIAPGVA